MSTLQSVQINEDLIYIEGVGFRPADPYAELCGYVIDGPVCKAEECAGVGKINHVSKAFFEPEAYAIHVPPAPRFKPEPPLPYIAPSPVKASPAPQAPWPFDDCCTTTMTPVHEAPVSVVPVAGSVVMMLGAAILLAEIARRKM